MFIFSWIDLIIILTLLICFILGFSKGMVKGIFTFAALIISIVIAKLYENSLSLFISGYGNIKETIKVFIGTNILPFLNIEEGVTGWMNTVNMYNLSKAAEGNTSNFWQNCITDPEGFSYAFVNNASDIIINIMSFIILFLLSYLILRIIVEIFDIISKLPVLNLLNRTGGGVIGLIKGVIFCIIIVTALYFISIYLSNNIISEALNNSILAPYFYINFIFT